VVPAVEKLAVSVSFALFAWFISHQPAVLFSQNKPATSNQPAVLFSPCSLGLSATSQQYFFLRTNQPPATSQQYFSLRTNQHQPSATSQTNRLFLFVSGGFVFAAEFYLFHFFFFWETCFISLVGVVGAGTLWL
jgi:hypothetical protein